jgi:hypothetical protein
MSSSKIFAASSRCIWLLIFLPVLMQLPSLLGYWNPDPSLFVAALGDHAQLGVGLPWGDPNVGYQAQALGKLSADLWLTAQVPWWNSYNGVGLPLAAEAQPASLFLPFVLLYHFRAGGLWVELLLQIIAGLCTYALLRKLKLVALAALSGALLFEFNGTFAWHGAPIIGPVAFLPMLLLGVEQLRERIEHRRPGGWWLIPLALAWSLYSGFPETAYINCLFIGFWVLARLGGIDQHQKVNFIAKLAFSVFLGVLCSLPQVLPFSEYLGLSYLGAHAGNFGHVGLPLPGFALSLLPWLYGPIAGYSSQVPALFSTWGGMGGYLTALQVGLAFFGVILAPRKLSLALLLWMLVCISKTFDWRPFSDLVNLIPLIKSAAFFRYAPPSWEFAGAVLIAFAVDGLQRNETYLHSRLIFTFLVSLALAATGLWLARDTVKDLLAISGYRIYLFESVGWLIFSVVAAVLLIANCGLQKVYLHTLILLIAVDACVAFALPVYGGSRNVQHDESGIFFLKNRIGMQRVYSLGPLAPNYGGYFDISQINHNQLPVSKEWLDYIHEHLDPAASSVTFVGEESRDNHGVSVEEELRERRVAYEELGVEYVLSSHGNDPFIEKLNTEVAEQGNKPLPLENGQATVLRWYIGSELSGRSVSAVSFKIGNYSNHADGVLNVQICIESGVCTSGRKSLSDSTDNAALNIILDKALVVPSGKSVSLQIRISHEQSHAAVALWLWPVTSGSLQQLALGSAMPGFAPAVSLQLVEKGQEAAGEKLVYSGQDMDIYQLPNPKPYFEVDGSRCDLKSVSRLQADLNCQGPAKLVRREAFYPGWMVSVNGSDRPVERAGEIFQRVNLAAGKQRVVFEYCPSHFGLMFLGFGLCIAGLLFGAWQDWKEFRRCAVSAASSSA